jgi:hypothetical protein
LPSTTPLNVSPFNKLSAEGNRAVFSTQGPSGTQVYTINSDGSGQTLVDSNGGYGFDISADGSVVLEESSHGTSGTKFRIVNADGTNLHDAFDTTTYSASLGGRLSADGQTVFFETVAAFTVNGVTYPAGVYAVSAAGGTPQLIASQSQVVAALVSEGYDVTASDIILYSGEPGGMELSLGASADGSRLVFRAHGNNVGDFLMGIDRNVAGSLHSIGPVGVAADGLNQAGISGDGSTVFRYDSVSGHAPQLTVYQFDGSGALTLNVPAGLVAQTGGPEHVQLTQDGSKLLLGSSALLINTDNSGVVQIGTEGNLNIGLPHYLVSAHLPYPTMNVEPTPDGAAAGTVFLYTFNDPNINSQLAVARLNPGSLGGDPAISNVSIRPPYLLTEVRSTTTISAAVSASSTPAGVTEAFLRGGVAEDQYPDGHDFSDARLYNDGTHGSTPGISTYTNNSITISYDPAPGPRTVRVSAETVDGSGLQHVTAVEVDGLTVIAQGPTHLNFIEPGTVTAGVPFQITVQVLDSNQHLVTGYLGTVLFTASNGAMASYTFQPGDMGQHTFTIPLRQAGTLEVVGIDTADSTIAGSTSFTVVAAAADHIALVLVPSGVTAGAPFSLTVTVQDAYGNTVTGYQRTVHFQLTGPVMPAANYTFTAADRGSHTFSGLVLNQTGMYTLMATDSADPLLNGMLTFTVS